MVLPEKAKRGAAVYEVMFSPASKMLSDCSVPTVYSGRGVCSAAFDENIKAVPEEELKKATLQSRMDDYAMQMYDISDSCLNEIWNLVKYNTSEEKFNEILTEQRKWIADKEAAGNEILDQNDGSSAQMDSSLKMAELTMERCEELADYLK